MDNFVWLLGEMLQNYYFQLSVGSDLQSNHGSNHLKSFYQKDLRQHYVKSFALICTTADLVNLLYILISILIVKLIMAC